MHDPDKGVYGMGELMTCLWCGYEYKTGFNRTEEDAHLQKCLVFQRTPVAEIKDGKEFLRHPSVPNILIERPEHLRWVN